MKKRMLIMLIGVSILFGGIFAYKLFVATMTKRFLAANKPVISVSTMKVTYDEWQPELRAVATVRAIKGVNITTELSGMVRTIYFTPGAYVKKGEVLVQLNAATEIASLEVAQANEKLAAITYHRDKAQYAAHAVSKQTLDTDEQNLKSSQAQVALQAATLAKKSIVVPFDGKIGISLVNPGQFINPGDGITTLQMLDPIYADFYVPQQELSRLKVGQAVSVTSDSFPHQTFTGTLTTINPLIDIDTRNILAEATLHNPNHLLTPGMFTYITIPTGKAKRYLTLPQTAITYNPYGNIVYLVKEKEDEKDPKGKKILTAVQAFVVTGETRGDQIQVLKGLEEGQTIVATGQLKLKNGSVISVNNKITLPNSPNPKVANER